MDGYDRTPGRGVGHLFVIARDGRLIRDIVLGHGIVYHPGGIDLRGDEEVAGTGIFTWRATVDRGI